MAPKRAAPVPGLGAPRKRANKQDVRMQQSKLKFRSPAEFFAENKNIAGFDNAGKSLYTTVREFVENGLDAAEAVHVLPDILIKIEELSVHMYQQLTKTSHQEKVLDPTLYKEHVEQKRAKGIAAKNKKKAGSQMQEKDEVDDTLSDDVPLRAGSKSGTAAAATAGDADAAYLPSNMFRITVTDNGSGMPHESIPQMMGRVLAGTKYCVRQNRGKFGLGSKMALIWSKMSTGLPIEIWSQQRGQKQYSHVILDIDITNNAPNVIEQTRHSANESTPFFPSGHGTTVSLIIEGNWTSYRSKIVQYTRQMAVITPYAEFKLQFIAGSRMAEQDSRSFSVVFQRRADKMPPQAQEVKHHPSSVNQLLIKQLIDQLSESKQQSMCTVDFLHKEFSNIDRKLAERLGLELGEELADKCLEALDVDDIRRLDTLLKAAHFDPPDGNCLSPAGEYNLRLGVLKEIRPELIATHAEPAEAFEGHPFIVEVAVSLGGVSIKPGITVHRFANRIPLLFEAGNDVVTKTVLKNIPWSTYKISTTNDRIGVFVSIVSTKIPFKGTGKEYIGDDATEIRQCVRRAIMQCCIQLRSKISRRSELKDQADRRRNLIKYVPNVARALSSLWNAVSIDASTQEDEDLQAPDIRKWVQTPPTEKQLAQQLLRSVEKQDLADALEQQQAVAADGIGGRGRTKDLAEAILLLPVPRATSNALFACFPTSVDVDGKEKPGGSCSVLLLKRLAVGL
ncbi:DNA topoisomerase 6 subunit B [Porphyridium purpureum]|uniref:DNA topoisomerase 6 subunit B n=1 Tax=Porphyridium purpureum TaxID=35688 RepID=A0A5J4YWD3_PORPP|nr:DNA topoisomerase 6 subunit B [Porphyridium purpureum]|eukprot:POR6311..scf209_3